MFKIQSFVNLRIFILAILFFGFLIPIYAVRAGETKKEIGTTWDRNKKSLFTLQERFGKGIHSVYRNKILRKSISIQEEKRKWWEEFYKNAEPSGCGGD
ncbi:hypothetical protein AB3N59_08380 [Leptospira sp. WS92.C1]